MLWGEELPATWEKALRVLMTKLRALLEECGIDGSTALTSAFGCYMLTLPAGAWIDVDAAAEALERAEAELAVGDLGAARSQATAAAALARRSFLPGEDGPWVEEKRRDLRDVLVRSLECLRDASFAAEEFAEAVRHAEEVTELEPFRESGYRRLMDCHAAAGNPAEALRVYERCRRFLADELGAYPSPETEAAYLEILRAEPTVATEDHVATEDAPPLRRRRRWAVVAVGALVLGGALAAGSIQLVADGGESSLEVEGNAVAAFDAGSGAVQNTVEAPAPPAAMAAGFGFVWSASADSNTVVVMDPETNTVRDTIPIESAPGGIAIGGGWVWVTNSLSGTVSQISPQTLSVVQTIRVGNGPTGIAAGNGYVWVANTSDHTISKLRASDGRRLAKYAAVSDPGALVVGEGAVWVASKLASVVVKLSPSNGEVLDRIAVGDGPAAVTVGAGSVWVASNLSGTVSRLEPDTGDVRGAVEIGSSADALTVVRGDVWVASALDGTVVRIDARNGGVRTIDIGERPTALATAEDTVYVGFRPSGASHAGGTLRVLGAGSSEHLDPANVYTPEAWSTLAMTNDGLVGWRRAGGQAGTELVPDLAVSLPSVSHDGRRYTFQLRRGIRYSNGRLVKARDVRYSIERVYKLMPKAEPAGVALYGAIVGADRCGKRPSRCDLSRGIVTDDRAGTVTFRLVRSDPEFLFKLAAPFAYVVPSGTSLRVAVRRSVPGTGPYRVASLSGDGSMRLVRNPHFREWSSAAQPAGFADEILFPPVADSADTVRLVAQGKADYTSSDIGEQLAVPPVHRARVHAQPLPMTFYLVVDTRRPPFDDVRARRALNYALDRNKFLRLGGGTSAARPTCQVLPPNFPGYEPYCPYTLDPKAGSGWTAPDLVKARNLITASGTVGTRVEFWWDREFGERAGRYLEQALDSLGFRARLRLFPGDLGSYFSAVKRRGASWHLAGTGWFADAPAASNFMNLLSCGSAENWGRFCDKAIDAKMRRARRLQERDPAVANQAWAALDRDLTDRAPWIFLYTPHSEVFVSKRVGNYQHHPLLGVLFAQLWVR